MIDSLGRWRCRLCGEWHEDVPLNFSTDYPAPYEDLPKRDRERARIDSTFCEVDGKWFFVRGVIEIPILTTKDSLCLGVWVSLSEKNFRFVKKHWGDVELERTEPMFGWLEVRLPLYPDTQHLKTNLYFQPGSQLPKVILEPTDHPLAVEQREGITVEALLAKVTQLLHPKS